MKADSDSEGAIRCGCGSGSGPNTYVSNVYLGTGAKGGNPPKNKIKTKPRAFCSGGGEGPTKSVQGLEADGAPKTNNRCKNRGKIKYRGGTTNAPPWAALSTKPACPTTKYRGDRQKREVFQPHRSNAGHYRVGQPNQVFPFRQGFSRGWGKDKRAAPPTAACGCNNHGGGGNPTPNLTKPVQGMEVDGVPGTTSRVPPWVCKNNEGGEGGNPPRKSPKLNQTRAPPLAARGWGKKGKILLNGWPPP